MDRVHQTSGSQMSSGGEMSSVEGLVDDIHSMCINVCQKRPSIYRVPEHLRKLNENAYTPWHVAIGPYHHRSHKYTIMEEHKMVYTKALICRRRAANNNAQVNKEEIDEYVKEVERLETKSRLNYAEKIEFSKEEFVKMLLIDGCFIVEFLCRKIKKLAKFEDEAMKNYDQMYKFINMTYNEVNLKNDFILKSTRTAFEVRRDLTLLENQLPYFVLEKLFDFTFSSKPNRPNFKAIVYCAFRTSIPNISHILNEEDIAQRIQLEPETTAHFVSFLKSCCGPAVGHDEAEAEAEAGDYFTADANIMVDDQRISINNVQDEYKKIEFPCLCNMKTHEIRVPSASVLAKSGVLFTKMDGETPMLHMNFDPKNGVLKLPVLILWHHTETFFRNIMAYELYNHTANYSKNVSVSDYMCFMDDLINSKEDVAVLVKSGIIQNWLESDEVVTNLFNSITKHILADYSSYSDTCKQMNEFRNKFNVRQLKAVLKQDYFNQPWAVVYFITGVIIQTTSSIIEAVTSVQDSKRHPS